MALSNPGETVVLVVFALGVMKVLTGPMGVAIGDRLRGAPARAADRLLADEVDRLRGRLEEVEERLDFAERLLARVAEADQIPGGANR